MQSSNGRTEGAHAPSAEAATGPNFSELMTTQHRLHNTYNGHVPGNAPRAGAACRMPPICSQQDKFCLKKFQKNTR